MTEPDAGSLICQKRDGGDDDRGRTRQADTASRCTGRSPWSGYIGLRALIVGAQPKAAILNTIENDL